MSQSDTHLPGQALKDDQFLISTASVLEFVHSTLIKLRYSDTVVAFERDVVKNGHGQMLSRTKVTSTARVIMRGMRSNINANHAYQRGPGLSWGVREVQHPGLGVPVTDRPMI